METINLGGEKYYILKKEEIDTMEQQKIKAEQDLKNIKTIVGNAFKGLDGLISFDNNHEQKVTPKTKVYSGKKRNQLFQPAPSAQMLWKITDIDGDGCFYGNGRKLKITIKDVFRVREVYHKNLTYGEVSDLQKELDLDYQMVHRLVYNYEKNIFDKWIVRWNNMTQPKVGIKHRPIVNNPEKRKELGY